MDTRFLLLAEFGQADVPLVVVAEKYLNMSREKALFAANRNELPFPAYRPGKSQKAEYMVRITDLAEWLDRSRAEAVDEWNKRNTA